MVSFVIAPTIYLDFSGNGTVSTEEAFQRHRACHCKRQAHGLAFAFFRKISPSAVFRTKAPNFEVGTSESMHEFACRAPSSYVPHR
jgi:hypothetical protein